jgi:hypothetical protein
MAIGAKKLSRNLASRVCRKKKAEPNKIRTPHNPKKPIENNLLFYSTFGTILRIFVNSGIMTTFRSKSHAK